MPLLTTRKQSHLKGFEYSRADKGKSSGRADFDLENNLYRHHNRQDVPTKSLTKEHDLYPIGVVLFEIGMWQTVVDIYKS